MAAPIPDEQAALLAAIVANPDDDAVRLPFASNGYIRADENPGLHAELIAAVTERFGGTNCLYNELW